MRTCVHGVGVNFATALHTKPESSLVHFLLHQDTEIDYFCIKESVSCENFFSKSF